MSMTCDPIANGSAQWNADKEPRWIDEQRLEAVGGHELVVLDNSKGNGSDRAAPIK
ncbi:hypothetical protein [Tianweitania sediminis]|uniref:Uncharacterized protein n=1 Tax=Tianweitania sediminis TaxID=1502156 RepID=A0A8J7R0Q4_9HYPH|nr:hypothetical protein [Tianweitania sediminis]MBP0438433.1 hypothetical protein [Tianweitania sediminis]